MVNAKNMLIRLVFAWMILAGCSLFAQVQPPPNQYTSSDKKAIKWFKEARQMYETRMDREAEELLQKVVERDPNFAEAHMLRAQMFQEQKAYEKAITSYQAAIKASPNYFPQNYYLLGEIFFYNGNYAEAIGPLKNYLAFPRIHEDVKQKAAFLVKCAEFAEEGIKHPVPFDPKNMGKEVNSMDYEYFPSMTADGKTLVFTRSEQKENGFRGQEDFYYSVKKDGNWTIAQLLPGINTSGNEGSPTLSADGTNMFCVACMEKQSGDYGVPSRKGMGSCDIFFSYKQKGKWTALQNVGDAVNSANWETQPSFSSDGKTLYFVRGIVNQHRIGEQDIYMSTLDENGAFTTPVKLGPQINTPGREESVFIHPDNQTLYFASNGHVGYGGLDLFMSKRQADGSWGPAINLGYPINTAKDENSLLVDPAGKLAYFASNREGGMGGLDLYCFELPDAARPEKITYVKGKVFDARSKAPLETAFELIDLDTQKPVSNTYSDFDGKFLLVLNAQHEYLLNCYRQGYLYYSDHFSLKGIETDFTKPYHIDVPLQPIDTGMVVELKNIFFDVDKFDLKAQSKAEVDKLQEFLVKNPKLRIEISGHTDNTGEKQKNQLLSENRAKAVYEALVKGGIPAARITFKGYGDTKPKVPNDTPENKQLNRRTEFKVVGFVK